MLRNPAAAGLMFARIGMMRALDAEGKKR